MSATSGTVAVSETVSLPVDDGLTPYRFGVDQYLRMIESEILPSDAKVELLNGIVVENMTKYPRHSFATMRVADWFRSRLSADWSIREEKPFVVDPSSRPEPDVLVAVGPVEEFQFRDPDASETALVVEVADSSYANDRGTKWALYASAGIRQYWIVDLNRSRVEVYTDPEGEGRSAAYRTLRIYPADAFVPVVIAGSDLGHAAVSDFLPRSPDGGAKR